MFSLPLSSDPKPSRESSSPQMAAKTSRLRGATVSATGSYGLRVALLWWTIGIALAAPYCVNLYRSSRGKVDSNRKGTVTSSRP